MRRGTHVILKATTCHPQPIILSPRARPTTSLLSDIIVLICAYIFTFLHFYIFYIFTFLHFTYFFLFFYLLPFALLLFTLTTLHGLWFLFTLICNTTPVKRERERERESTGFLIVDFFLLLELFFFGKIKYRHFLIQCRLHGCACTVSTHPFAQKKN